MMRFSAILYKRENFCDFLFAFLHIKSFLKRGVNSFLLEKNPFQKYGKKYFSRLSHLNMYSNPFSLACPRLLDIGFVQIWTAILYFPEISGCKTCYRYTMVNFNI